MSGQSCFAHLLANIVSVRKRVPGNCGLPKKGNPRKTRAFVWQRLLNSQLPGQRISDKKGQWKQTACPCWAMAATLALARTRAAGRARIRPARPSAAAAAPGPAASHGAENHHILAAAVAGDARYARSGRARRPLAPDETFRLRPGACTDSSRVASSGPKGRGELYMTSMFVP